VVLVEHETDGHAPFLRCIECGEDCFAGARVQPQVVEGYVQRLRRTVEERGDAFGD